MELQVNKTSNVDLEFFAKNPSQLKAARALVAANVQANARREIKKNRKRFNLMRIQMQTSVVNSS